MLRRLRILRETRRPCLEACLRFLLYGNEDEKQRRTAHISYDSSSDEETYLLRSKREPIVTPLHGGDKNIAEPVTSQGVFGPNGESHQFAMENWSLTLNNRPARLLQPRSTTHSP
jgi:WD repeat-containing protein 59